MQLFSRYGATAVDDATHGHIEANEDGSFDFPDELGRQLHSFAVNGKKLWETHIERQHRQIAEEVERRKDPATLLDAVNKLVEAAQAAPAPAAAPAKAPRSRKPAAAPPAE